MREDSKWPFVKVALIFILVKYARDVSLIRVKSHREDEIFADLKFCNEVKLIAVV